MSKILLLYGAIISIIGPTLQTNYCAICENKSHTMCKYKKGPSDKCIGYSSNKMTPEIVNLIVGLHNEIRNKLASGRETGGKKLRFLPPGTNMHAVKWDQELATIAQRWADQCVSILEKNQHDECKTTDRFAVGQNVIQTIRIPSIINFKKFVAGMVSQWYKEVKKVDPPSVVRFRSSTNWNTHIGNFAQLVWGQTKYIGCAHTSFTYGFGILDRLVCNYGPAGNIVGNSIYQTGPPGSKCGHSSKKYPALCDDDLDSFPRNKRQYIKSKQLKPVTESNLNNSNIYKTDESEFKLNHHLTQKLFELFEKLNLTLSNNLLMQLNDIHNKYNISQEVQDISKHVQEPEDVAYFDELEFLQNINKTFEWKLVGRTNKSKTVSGYRIKNRKQFGKQMNFVKSTETTEPTPKLTQVSEKLQEESSTTVHPDELFQFMYRGDKCFCYY